MPILEIRTKVQVIYYETPDEELGKFFATSDKRISIEEGHHILQESDIEYSKLLKIQYEVIDLDIEHENFKSLIKL